MEEHEIKKELEKAKFLANKKEDGGIAIQTSSKTLPKCDISEKNIGTYSVKSDNERPHPSKNGMNNMGCQLNGVGNSESFYNPPGTF